MGKQSRLNEIDKRLGDLVADLILDAHYKKYLDPVSLDEVYKLLEELKELVYGEKFILRSIVDSILFFRFSLEGESDYFKNPKECMRVVYTIDDYLGLILSDAQQNWRKEEY